jgi:hypothetical protein
MLYRMSHVLPVIIKMSNYILLKKQIKFRLLKTTKFVVFLLPHVVVIHPLSRVEICNTGEIAWD